MSERFQLETPPEPIHAATARLFASVVARHFQVREDVVEDLKLAVSEAVTRMLGSGTEETITVAVTLVDQRLVVEIPQTATGPVTRGSPQTPEQLSAAFGLELIEALFDDASLVTSDGRPAVRFSLPTG